MNSSINLIDLLMGVKDYVENPLRNYNIISLKNLTKKDLYSTETDSKGVPLLNKIEKYKDLPENIFIPAEYILPDGSQVLKIYEVNKLGQIRNRETGNILKSYKDKDGYLICSLGITNPERKSARIKTHRLIASTFLINPNPNLYSIANHNDHNRQNNRLDNLFWVTTAKNGDRSDNTNRGYPEEIRMRYIAMDNLGNELFSITDNNPEHDGKIYNTRSIRTSINNNSKFYGYYWKRSRPISKIENLKLAGYTGNLNDYIWYKHPLYNDLYVCKEGFVKYRNKISYTLDKSGYAYVSLWENNTTITIRINRVIAEFLEERHLTNNELVDHINTNTLDNSFENLRLVDIKGNNNNYSTKLKQTALLVLCDLFGNVIKIDFAKNLKKYINEHINKNTKKLKEASSSNTLLNNFIIKDKFIVIKPNDSETLYRKMEHIIYVFEDNKLVDSFTNYKENANKLFNKKPPKVLTEYINTEKKTDKGYTLISGINAVKKIVSLGFGNAANYKVNLKDFKEKPNKINYANYEKYLEK